MSHALTLPLQTEAVLDVEKDEWVIHTPDEGAIKWWIGNAAEDGKAATVFARLKASLSHNILFPTPTKPKPLLTLSSDLVVV